MIATKCKNKRSQKWNTSVINEFLILWWSNGWNHEENLRVASFPSVGIVSLNKEPSFELAR